MRVLPDSEQCREQSRKALASYMPIERQLITGVMRIAIKRPARKPITALRRSIYIQVRKAIESGVIAPGPCADCGQIKERNHGHHEDYARPLELVWLCASCHARRHGKDRSRAAQQ